MDIDIKELIKAATENMDLSKFKGDVVAFKYVENEFGNIEPGGIGLQVNYADSQPNRKGLKDMPSEDEPLKNFIFNTSYFNSNAKLVKLRNTIAAAIDLGDETDLFGEPLEQRINPTKKNEWYYIMKAVVESGVVKSNITDKDFVEQMVDWFPQLFPMEQGDTIEAEKRKLAKSISCERSRWRKGGSDQEVTLRETWAKDMGRTLGAKAERMFKIAYSGLLTNLKELKKEISKMDSNKE